MSRQISFAPAAEYDLDQIWRYLSQFGADVGDRIVDRIASSTDRLHEHPFSGPSLGRKSNGLRRVSAHGYVIIYTVKDDDVLVVRVFDARRNWRRELGLRP